MLQVDAKAASELWGGVRLPRSVVKSRGSVVLKACRRVRRGVQKERRLRNKTRNNDSQAGRCLQGVGRVHAAT